MLLLLTLLGQDAPGASSPADRPAPYRWRALDRGCVAPLIQDAPDGTQRPNLLRLASAADGQAGLHVVWGPVDDIGTGAVAAGAVLRELDDWFKACLTRVVSELQDAQRLLLGDIPSAATTLAMERIGQVQAHFLGLRDRSAWKLDVSARLMLDRAFDALQMLQALERRLAALEPNQDDALRVGLPRLPDRVVELVHRALLRGELPDELAAAATSAMRELRVAQAALRSSAACAEDPAPDPAESFAGWLALLEQGSPDSPSATPTAFLPAMYCEPVGAASPRSGVHYPSLAQSALVLRWCEKMQAQRERVMRFPRTLAPVSIRSSAHGAGMPEGMKLAEHRTAAALDTVMHRFEMLEALLRELYKPEPAPAPGAAASATARSTAAGAAPEAATATATPLPPEEPPDTAEKSGARVAKPEPARETASTLGAYLRYLVAHRACKLCHRMPTARQYCEQHQQLTPAGRKAAREATRAHPMFVRAHESLLHHLKPLGADTALAHPHWNWSPRPAEPVSENPARTVWQFLQAASVNLKPAVWANLDTEAIRRLMQAADGAAQAPDLRALAGSAGEARWKVAADALLETDRVLADLSRMLSHITADAVRGLSHLDVRVDLGPVVAYIRGFADDLLIRLYRSLLTADPVTLPQDIPGTILSGLFEGARLHDPSGAVQVHTPLDPNIVPIGQRLADLPLPDVLGALLRWAAWRYAMQASTGRSRVDLAQAHKLREQGRSNAEIARHFGVTAEAIRQAFLRRQELG